MLFVFSAAQHEIALIHDAMQQWMELTCIMFRPATAMDYNYVIFQDGLGCSSHVGKARGPAPIILQKPCRKVQIFASYLFSLLRAFLAKS